MYIPIIKTTAAELYGFEQLSEKVKTAVLPLFELTKDRTHRNYPEGRLLRALERMLNAHPEGYMIVDLTSHEDLINSEIERLFSDDDGYLSWRNFLLATNCMSRIYPVIQIDADHFAEDPLAAGANVEMQVRELLKHCERVVFRANLGLEVGETAALLEHVVSQLDSPEQVIFILDVEYIKPLTADTYAKEVVERLSGLNADFGLKSFAVAASSFPKSVVSAAYGDEEQGEFSIEEVRLHKIVEAAVAENIQIIYSDYGSIHPIRYEVKGGTWVPRVDVPLETKAYYHRKRREEGGYVAAAKLAKEDSRYKTVNAWGNAQIELAAGNEPGGLSPSFWISVRSNIHITTQAIRVGLVEK